MSKTSSIRTELTHLQNEWKELDPTLRFLDLLSMGLIVLFGIGYILVNILDIVLTVSNAGMLIFPLLLSGYTFVLRSKLAKEEEDHEAAKREYFMLVGLTIGLVLLSIIYSILLNRVLL